MKIEINLKIFFAIFVFLILNNIDTYLTFFLFVIIHELAHLIVGILIGGIPKKLYINALGVSLEFYSYGKNKILYKLLFYISGPFINFLIFLLFTILGIDNLKIIYINLILCIFNMLPIVPLDGGKILMEILKRVFSIKIGMEYSLLISKISLFIITIIYGVLIIEIKNIYILVLIIYLWYLYLIEKRKYTILKNFL